MKEKVRVIGRVAVDPTLLARCKPYMQATGCTAKKCVDEGLLLFLEVKAPAVLEVLGRPALSQGEIPRKAARRGAKALRLQTA